MKKYIINPIPGAMRVDFAKPSAEDAKKTEWISVKDQLPKAGKILVTDGETVTISNGAWLYRSRDGEIRVPANYGAGLTVTYWMPLPKPPKEEER